MSIDPILKENLSYEDYDKWQGVRSTHLKTMSRSMAHYKQSLLETEKWDSPALQFGRFFHTAVLEPALFKKNFCVMPEFDGKTKDGKVSQRSAATVALKKAWIEKLEPGQVVVTPEQQTTLTGMLEAIMSHPLASRLLKDVPREVSLQWFENKIAQKCRFDFISPDGTPFDLKTTRDASSRSFDAEIFHRDRKYYLSAAHYTAGAKALNKNIRHNKFGFIAIEKEPPYGISVKILDHHGLSPGKHERKRLLQNYKQSLDTNIWPGYDVKASVSVPPPWMFEPDDFEGFGEE